MNREGGFFSPPATSRANAERKFISAFALARNRPLPRSTMYALPNI
jgi:hypothetical protein